MANYIATPKISEILSQEFMKPMGISVDQLAQGIDVPASSIHAILQDRCTISPKISARLGAYFGLSPQYFLNLQNDIGVRNARHSSPIELAGGK